MFSFVRGTKTPLLREHNEYMCDFFHNVQGAIRRGSPVRRLSIPIDGYDIDVEQPDDEHKLFIEWIRTTTTLEEVTVAGQSEAATVVCPWILRALLDRDPTFPSIHKLCCVGIDLTADDFARLLKVCQPELFNFTDCAILTSSRFPSKREALDHAAAALRGTSTILKSIVISTGQDNNASLSAMLQALQNHDKLSTVVWGTSSDRFDSTPSPVELTQGNANALVDFLQQSTGQLRRLGLTNFVWKDNAAFASLASAFHAS
jgi:hypothetical protein